MKALAKERRDDAAVSLEKVEIRLEGFAEIRSRLEQNQAEVSEARKRSELLQGASESVRQIDERVEAAQSTLDAVSKRLTMLDGYAERFPDQAATSKSIEDAAAAEQRRGQLASELDEAQKKLQQAEKALQRANEDSEPELLEKAGRLLAAADPQLKAVVEADRRIAKAKESAASAQAAVIVAQQKLDEAEQVRDHSLGRSAEAARILEDAEAALQSGRHLDMATTLRSGLLPNDVCPVCEQIVDEVPEAPGESHLDELELVVSTARQTKADVDKAYTQVLTTLERLRGQVGSAVEKATAAVDQIAGAEDDAIRVRGDLEETTIRLEKILGPGDPGEHLKVRREAFESLLAAREEAQRRVDQVRGLHDQSIRDEQESAKALQDLGMTLADLAARLEVTLDIGDDAASLGSALDHLRDTWATVTAGLGSDQKEAQKSLLKLGEERSQLLGDLGVTGDVAAAVAVVADRILRLEKALDADTEAIEAAEDFEGERTALKQRVEMFERINVDLTDSRFIRFLLDDERARLAELGSEHFQRLSAGRYRFADDQFAIVDLTAADSTRRADSLSGGETFLASLGLALALAEMVAGTGGRLDSFFLDEGFGTLDPEHLDLAMEGVEMLISDQASRLVVIVSHVPELRERIEDLIELERNPVTGDTRVVTR